MSGIAEFLLMVRWLRSIDSLIISRLRSAVMLFFSSIVVSFFNDVLLLVYYSLALSVLLQKAHQRPIVSGSRCKDR